MRLRVTDDGGKTNSITATINISNVIPTISLSGNPLGGEGEVYTLTLGAVFDPGFDTISACLINWGDGTTGDCLSGIAGDLLHTFLDGPTCPSIFVNLTDEDGLFNFAGTLDICVNNMDPSITLNGNASINEGNLYTLNLGAVYDLGADLVSVCAIDWGDGSIPDDCLSSLSDIITHTMLDGLAIYTITVDLTDEDGFFPIAGSFTFTVNNISPTLDISGSASVDEGDLYTLNLSAVTDPGDDTISACIVHWGDGNSNSCMSTKSIKVSATHTYTDGNSNPSITVDLTDEDGTYVSVDTLTLTVNNITPTLEITGFSSVDEGDLYTLTLSGVTDPGDDTISACTVHWGDGNSNSCVSTKSIKVSASHTYTDGNTNPTISVDLTDEDGTYVSVDTLALTVNNISPTLDISGSASVDEGDLYTLNLSGVTDPGDDTISACTVYWGDGNSDSCMSTKSIKVSATHSYTDGNSNPTISVDLTDEDGTYVSVDTLSITVNNVAPTIDLTGNASVDEGSEYTLTLSAVTDPGDDTVTVCVVDWDDGSPAENCLSAIGGSMTYTYTDNSVHTISVDLTDEDGTHSAAGVLAINVNNVPPTLDQPSDQTVWEDEINTYSFTYSDPGSDDTHSYSIDWDDGLPISTGAGSGGSFNNDHTFKHAGNYAIRVTVTDDDAGSDTKAFTVTVKGRMTFFSSGREDGWVLESSEDSSRGGMVNSKGKVLRVGDDASDRQYRGFLSFNTLALPNNATVISGTLSIRKYKTLGNPYATLGSLFVDMRTKRFGRYPRLESRDFNAKANLPDAFELGMVANGSWATVVLPDGGLDYINLMGRTQFRMHFDLDDDDDNISDYVYFYTGDFNQSRNWPRLTIYYSVP